MAGGCPQTGKHASHTARRPPASVSGAGSLPTVERLTAGSEKLRASTPPCSRPGAAASSRHAAPALARTIAAFSAAATGVKARQSSATVPASGLCRSAPARCVPPLRTQRGIAATKNRGVSARIGCGAFERATPSTESRNTVHGQLVIASGTAETSVSGRIIRQSELLSVPRAPGQGPPQHWHATSIGRPCADPRLTRRPVRRNRACPPNVGADERTSRPGPRESDCASPKSVRLRCRSRRL